MKRLFLLLLVSAFAIHTANCQNKRYVYGELWELNTSRWISVNLGELGSGKIANGKLIERSENGKERSFKLMVNAQNYMASQGWEVMQIIYRPTASTYASRMCLIRKDYDLLTQSEKELITQWTETKIDSESDQ